MALSNLFTPLVSLSSQTVTLMALRESWSPAKLCLSLLSSRQVSKKKKLEEEKIRMCGDSYEMSGHKCLYFPPSFFLFFVAILDGASGFILQTCLSHLHLLFLNCGCYTCAVGSCGDFCGSKYIWSEYLQKFSSSIWFGKSRVSADHEFRRKQITLWL